MRNIVTLLFFLLVTTVAAAQPKGYTVVKNVTAFQQSLSAANAKKQTITSDFTQVKNLSLLADKIRSKGKFYFKKEDKIRIEYTSPYTYLLVMNAGQILVKDEQKTSRVNMKNSKVMQSVNRIMLDCMRGTVFQNPDFKVQAYENAQGYLLSLTPATAAMQKMFQRIEVYMSKGNFDVTRLTMTEVGGDLTDMNFTNTRHNAPLNDAIFKVK